MALLESLLLALAPAIGKALRKAWLGESAVAGLADPVLDVLFKSSGDKLKQRQQRQQIETIGRQVAEDMRPFFDSETRGLSKDERTAVVYALAETLEQAQFDTGLLIGCGFDAGRLAEQLQALRANATRDLSATQTSVYERLLRETSRTIVKLAPQLDGFSSGVAIETVQDVQRLTEMVSALLRQPDQAAQQFERDYREAVRLHLDRMEYFGIPHVDTIVRRQPLSAAYVTLLVERRDVEREQPDVDQPDAEQAQPLSAAERHMDDPQRARSGSVDLLLSQARRLVILGEAGGGKSTLLQWIAVSAARQSFIGHLTGWNDLVPFFIRLRERVGQEFPPTHELATLVARDLADQQPQGWVRQQLKIGRALVLVDGVDELPREQREAMLERLDQIVRDYPLARYVITSRPSALKPDEWPEWADWIKQAEFVEASLQPLDTAQIEHLIDRWHEALAASPLDAAERTELTGLAARLKRQLRQRPALRRLATNPLLCAMLCALHRDRGASLPAERIKLYDECVEMLLERRDIKRGVKSDADYPRMSYDQKLALLKSFALWMIRNSASDVECEEADEHFERELPALSLETSGEQVRAFFVERSALLREPVEGRIDFTHRTFQEYLGAQAALEEKGIGELLSHAHDDQWRETIILAAGKARPQECEKLLRGLIDRGDRLKQARNRHQLHLLAVACLETVVKVSPETRQYVLDQARAFFPPKDMDDARLIAAAGDPAVPLLQRNREFTNKEDAACVRALSLIGSDAALEAIVGYVDRAYWEVQEEIGRVWESFDRTEYARKVLRATTALRLPFSPSAEHITLLPHVVRLTIREVGTGDDLTPLVQLSRLSALDLLECRQLTDLTPLAQLSSLTQLSLSNCNLITDLTPLAQLSSLTQLSLSNCNQLTDLTPLAQLSSLTQLSLSNCNLITDFTPLARLPNLSSLNLLRSEPLTDLAPLAQLFKLTWLRLVGGAQPTDLTPLAQLPNLSSLDLPAYEQLTDLTPLAQLPNLSSLDLSRCPQLTDLTPLAQLLNLSWLNLSRCPQLTDLTPLAQLPNLSWLNLSRCPQLTDLTPLANLMNLKRLDIRDTGVRDISPLKHLTNLEIIR